MINSLKNEADIVEKFGSKPADIGRIGEMAKYDRRIENNRLSKWTSYQPSSHLASKTTNLESYSLTDNHNNHPLKYVLCFK